MNVCRARCDSRLCAAHADAPAWRRPAFHLASCIALTFIYGDATLRVVDGLFGGGFGLLLGRRACHRRRRIRAATAVFVAAAAAASAAATSGAPPRRTDRRPGGRARRGARHAGVLANLHSDLASWIDRETRVSASQMRDTINFVAAHRGKWDSWVTDTMTLVLIVGNEIFAARAAGQGPDQLLLDGAAGPAGARAAAQGGGRRVPIEHGGHARRLRAGRRQAVGADPHLPYCKTRRFLDILIPGYYSPDRTQAVYADVQRKVPVARQARGALREVHPLLQAARPTRRVRALPAAVRPLVLRGARDEITRAS